MFNTTNTGVDGAHYIRDIRVKLVSCALERERLIDQLAGQFDVDPIDAYLEANYGIKVYYTDAGGFLPEYKITDNKKYLIFMLKF